MAETNPPFAVGFRDDNPHANRRLGVYEQALELADLVDKLVDQAERARFHLKELLDKSATIVVLRCAQAAGELGKGERRRQYNLARKAATDSAALLEILGRRKCADAEALVRARELVLALVSQLSHLASR